MNQQMKQNVPQEQELVLPTKEQVAAKRTVRLIYSSCCGCGCSDVSIWREVDGDSPLKNGDRAENVMDKDSTTKPLGWKD